MKQRESTDWNEAVNAASRLALALKIASACDDGGKQLIAAERALGHLRDVMGMMGVKEAK